jgi:pSer/pThr/pTyr-binding forkhead associated (FHA) protein
MFKLVIQDDEGKTTVVPLIRDEITIGRKEGNTIRLTERNVSRRHARILRSNNEVQIEDLGSYNGIRVNNARIAERVSLRISDQVQIGDYKLYLKAEGVEQVDDARTMPIERIENVGPTEVMPAVSGTATTQTSPIPATPAPPASRQLGVADTDPAGRPVATPAQVAALTTSTGYGKLVVLSANFAGKEFELTRPQMIVGRTDENDMVVNHRSISRNHAKITRDPDTQRYTISDLQSSNGVRVNGQDYGKVELRRGDVVDLGHVRLRFVEPGEDFVFSRDAVINDVEGTGGKRTTMIAVLLAVVVIGAIVAYFALKGGGGNGDKNGSNNPIGSNDLVATGSGSGSGAPLIVDSIDAGSAIQIDPNDEGKRLSAECDAAVGEKSWSTVSMCADKLKQFDPAKAEELKKRALAETKADVLKGKVEIAIGEGNLGQARQLAGQIPDSSVYKKDVDGEVDQLENRQIEAMVKAATANKAANKCRENDVLIGQAAKVSAKAAEAVRNFKCTVAPPPPEDCSTALRNETKACKNQFCAKNPENSKCVVAVQAPACDADNMVQTGTAEEARGNHTQALAQYDAALKCKFDTHTLQLSFMAACNGSKVEFAKKYWKRMSPDMQSHMIQICLHNHITADMLNQ